MFSNFVTSALQVDVYYTMTVYDIRIRDQDLQMAFEIKCITVPGLAMALIEMSVVGFGLP